MIFSNKAKWMFFLCLSTSILLSACQSEAGTKIIINPAATKAVQSAPDMTYGIKDNSIYEKPKIVKYNPYTGDKKTIFEAPPAPSDLYAPGPDILEENVAKPSLPKAELRARLRANLSDLLGEHRAAMFDAQVRELNRLERKAVETLRWIINAPLARNAKLLVPFTTGSQLNLTWLSERCFYEASDSLQTKDLPSKMIADLVKKYWQISPDFSQITSDFIKYDASRKVFSLLNAQAWLQAEYLGSDLIDLQIKSNGSDIYVNAHEINYQSLNHYLDNNEQKSISPEAGLITCGDWLIGYYDNRFASSHIKNGGIIFADYYWLDTYDYELKYLPAEDSYYLASKTNALGQKDKSKYKARIVSPVPTKNINFQAAVLDLKLREEYLAAALPKTAQFAEQVVASYTKDEQVLFLNIPFNDYVLAFSLERDKPKRPAFIRRDKLLSKQTQTK